MGRECIRCEKNGRVIKRGYYTTRWNRQSVPRYFCKQCRKSFSTHTRLRTYRQKKPYLNRPIFDLYNSTMTQRRIARVLCVNRKTVVRKFLFLSLLARQAQEVWLKQYRPMRTQFDEMESFEHTRLKPVCVALCVDELSRNIVDIQVGSMPYKGKWAGISFRKYGPRKDERPQLRRKVLSRLSARGPLTIVTDGHPSYPAAIKSTLPLANHLAFEASKERKFKPHGSRRNVDDPLFALNHTAAKMRHDLSRLLRKVWVTTKRTSRLQAHLDLYIAFHNGLKLPR